MAFDISEHIASITVRVILNIIQRVTNNFYRNASAQCLSSSTSRYQRLSTSEPSFYLFKFLVLEKLNISNQIYGEKLVISLSCINQKIKKILLTRKKKTKYPQPMLQQKLVNGWDEDSKVLPKGMSKTTQCINSILPELIILPASTKHNHSSSISKITNCIKHAQIYISESTHKEYMYILLRDSRYHSAKLWDNALRLKFNLINIAIGPAHIQIYQGDAVRIHVNYF